MLGVPSSYVSAGDHATIITASVPVWGMPPSLALAPCTHTALLTDDSEPGRMEDFLPTPLVGAWLGGSIGLLQVVQLPADVFVTATGNLAQGTLYVVEPNE